MRDTDHLLHIASHLSGSNHSDPTLIDVTRAGVANVLNAAVAKFVMTSSRRGGVPRP